MVDQDQAMADARDAAGPTAADTLLERIAQLIGAKASVRAVFGEAVRHGDLTVIPVARVRWGFGGGGGRSDTPDSGPASGSGGGGGLAADPIGYLEIGPDGTVFRPIREPYPSPAFLLATGVAATLVIRALARLIRDSGTEAK
jgi:uncharacterized spore protein YtfJ